MLCSLRAGTLLTKPVQNPYCFMGRISLFSIITPSLGHCVLLHVISYGIEYCWRRFWKIVTWATLLENLHSELCNQVRLKRACSALESSNNLGISGTENIGIFFYAFWWIIDASRWNRNQLFHCFKQWKYDFWIFTVWGYLFHLFFMNSRLKSSIVYLSEIAATTLMSTADVTYCADVTFFSACDVRRAVTDCRIFSAPISCVLLL